MKFSLQKFKKINDFCVDLRSDHEVCSPKSRGPDLRAEKIFLQTVFSSRQQAPRSVSSPILKSIGPLEPSERMS